MPNELNSRLVETSEHLYGVGRLALPGDWWALVALLAGLRIGVKILIGGPL